jgi:DMSO/TMAO reductase YedYZ molybdopterin-dependent catalytic subunit
VPTAVAAGAGAAVGIGLLERSAPARPVFTLATLAAIATGTLRAARARRHHRDRPPVPAPDRPLPAAVDGAERWTGVSPLHTPLDRFYATDVAVGRPRIDPGRWRLSVGGLVRRPLELDLAGLAALGPVELDAVLVCIHNPAGGDRVGNGRWTGVPVPELLAAAGVLPEATHLVTRSDDGFTITLPLRLVTADPPALVALGLGGEPLTAAHGFPARVLTPGIYGQYGGVKWVTGLRLVREPAADYWVRRGWPADPAPVRPGARIDSPRPGRPTGSPVELTGVAWAPPHGVAAVEVAVDGGPPRPAELAAELGPAAWRRWRLPGVELGPGDHRLAARAVPRGPAPADLRHRPYPSGQTGVHEITVRRRSG